MNPIPADTAHHVLVDYENTQSLALEEMEGKATKVVLFLGESQKSLPVDWVKVIVRSPGLVELFESAGSGKNALDFQLAFHVGRIFEREPCAFVHVLSRDKGFDPLVRYLVSQGRKAERVDTWRALSFLAPARRPERPAAATSSASPQPGRSAAPASGRSPAPSGRAPAPAPRGVAEVPAVATRGGAPDPDRLAHTLKTLSRSAVPSRPRRLRTLKAAINSFFANGLPEDEVERVLDAMVSQGKVTLSDKGGVSYHF